MLLPASPHFSRMRRLGLFLIALAVLAGAVGVGPGFAQCPEAPAFVMLPSTWQCAVLPACGHPVREAGAGRTWPIAGSRASAKRATAAGFPAPSSAARVGVDMRPAALCLAAVAITSACAMARVPTGDHVRVKYGRIAVAADRPEAVQGGFTQPMTSQREAMKDASSTFGRNYGERFGRALISDPRVILLLPLMPVVGLVGVTTSVIYGAVAAESPEAVAAGATALRRALDELEARGGSGTASSRSLLAVTVTTTPSGTIRRRAICQRE